MMVNGKPYAHRDGLSIHALLRDLKVDGRIVVVMRGDDIWHAGKAPDAPIEKDDVIEIVTMSQGG